MVENKHFPFYAPCDFGFLADYLSIFEVKVKKRGGEKAIRNYLACREEVERQIGRRKTDEVVRSSEYQHLVKMNENLFDMVDAVKLDSCKGKELDDCVWYRYLAKKSVQEKFFPEQEQLEQKIGYEQK